MQCSRTKKMRKNKACVLGSQLALLGGGGARDRQWREGVLAGCAGTGSTQGPAPSSQLPARGRVLPAGRLRKDVFAEARGASEVFANGPSRKYHRLSSSPRYCLLKMV